MSPIAVLTCFLMSACSWLSRLPVAQSGDNATPMDAISQSLRQSMGHESPTLSAWQFVGLIFAVALMAVILRLVTKQVESRTNTSHLNCPDALFAEIASAHRLTRQDRRLLLRIAKMQELADPSRLFLEPDRLVIASNSGRFRRARQRINMVGLKLFGDIRTFGMVGTDAVEETTADDVIGGSAVEQPEMSA